MQHLLERPRVVFGVLKRQRKEPLSPPPLVKIANAERRYGCARYLGRKVAHVVSAERRAETEQPTEAKA